MELSEEEKKAIELMEICMFGTEELKIIKNIIDKQQKEIERLKQEIKDITSIPNDDIEYDEEGNEL